MNLIITTFAFNYGKYVILLSCLILLVIGLINIKEFFFFGKGMSLKLPEKYVKTTKKLLEEGTSLSIIILAGLITIVEFPCSGVMYLGFSSAFISWHSSIFEYLIYLFLYNIIFVLPLILITCGYIITNDVDQFKKFRLKYRRLFRLIMGIVMIGLAIWLYFHYFK
jgi:cytochrome c biogenesis protein CcdA